MTYPPQDPGPSAPGSPAGDPLGQSQPPPPAGGYAPGQVGAQYPDSAYPTTAVPAAGAQPQYAPQVQMQPPYDPNNPYASYGYGPPPVQSTTKGGAGTALLVIGVVLLMAIGAVGGYFLLGGEDDEGTLGAGGDTSTTQEEAPTDEGDGGDGSEDPGATEEEPPAPSGTGLVVDMLGTVTPLPEGEWQPYLGPGASEGPMADMEAYALYHTEAWISFYGAGVYSSLEAQYDPADLEASAASAADVWLTGAFDGVENYEMSEIAYTEVEVDGRPGVLAEWRNSWTFSDATPDLYEDTAILVVDADGVNGFIGVASLSESGSQYYDSAVEGLLATTFDSETA